MLILHLRKHCLDCERKKLGLDSLCRHFVEFSARAKLEGIEENVEIYDALLRFEVGK